MRQGFFCAGFGSRWSNFWFRILFPNQYAHMGELVDDVIRLEGEKTKGAVSDVTITTGTNTKTITETRTV